jgi:hypothetical protein
MSTHASNECPAIFGVVGRRFSLEKSLSVQPCPTVLIKTHIYVCARACAQRVGKMLGHSRTVGRHLTHKNGRSTGVLRVIKKGT